MAEDFDSYDHREPLHVDGKSKSGPMRTMSDRLDTSGSSVEHDIIRPLRNRPREGVWNLRTEREPESFSIGIVWTFRLHMFQPADTRF
jgi:hypothetical protein